MTESWHEARVSVLIVRAWVELGAADPAQRIRLVSRLDVTDAEHEYACTTTVPQALEHIRGWLERVLDEPQRRPGSGDGSVTAW